MTEKMKIKGLGIMHGVDKSVYSWETTY